MLYEPNVSYWDNYQKPLTLAHMPDDLRPGPQNGQRFFGLDLVSPVGVSACPITTAKGIKHLANLGFDYLVYKTVRSRYAEPHELPNVFYAADELTGDNSYNKAWISHNRTSSSLANSVGMPSLSPDKQLSDIRHAKSYLKNGQILAVSVFGEGTDWQAWAEDVIHLATNVTQAGANVVEINLCCPNVASELDLAENGCDSLQHGLERIVNAVKPVPIVVKLGYMDNSADLTEVLRAIACSGVQGVAGINAFQAHVVDERGRPAFGEKRRYAGVSGKAIRHKALQFVRDCRSIINQYQLNIILIGIGGVITASDFDVMLKAGADITLTASGAMLNPYMAWERLQWLKTNNN